MFKRFIILNQMGVLRSRCHINNPTINGLYPVRARVKVRGSFFTGGPKIVSGVNQIQPANLYNQSQTCLIPEAGRLAGRSSIQSTNPTLIANHSIYFLFADAGRLAEQTPEADRIPEAGSDLSLLGVEPTNQSSKPDNQSQVTNKLTP